MATVVQRLMRECAHAGKRMDSDPLVRREGAIIRTRVIREEHAYTVQILIDNFDNMVDNMRSTSSFWAYIDMTTYHEEEELGLIASGRINSPDAATASNAVIANITRRLNDMQRVRWCDCGNLTTKPSVDSREFCDRCTAQGMGVAQGMDVEAVDAGSAECQICTRAVLPAHAAPTTCCSARYHVGCLKEWNYNCPPSKRGKCPQCSAPHTRLV